MRNGVIFFIRVGFLPQFTLIDSWVRYNVYHLSYFNVSNSFKILKRICEVMKEFSAIGQRLSNWGYVTTAQGVCEQVYENLL